MILLYYPDTDTLDVDFRDPDGPPAETRAPQGTAIEAGGSAAQESTALSREAETNTHEAEPSGRTLAHYSEDRLEGLTIEHATHRAPAAWDVESLRREAARVAASTGRVVESVTHDLRRDRTSFQTGALGPHSPYTSDEAVREYNQMIDEIEAASAAA